MFGPPDKGFLPFQQADVSHIRRKWLDVPYAAISRAQQLDIYLPDEGDGPFPVILHVHGGGFELGDKRDMPLLPLLQGLGRGYAVVSANYRLSDEANFPAGLHDVKAAVRWLRAHAPAYHLDGERIAAWGGSAGGWYVVMLCLTAHVPELEDLSLGNPDVPCSVLAGVDWFGPMDFATMDEHFVESGPGMPGPAQAHSPESRFLGAKIAEAPDLVRRANPLTYVHAGAPPLLIQHGRIDPLVPVQQSMILAQRLEEIAGRERFEFEILENAGHGDPLFETDENIGRVFGFLDRHLK